jgi:RNA polymerase sigma-70 factor (ECF subfamily)
MMPANSTVPLTDEQLALQAATGCLDSFAELARRFQIPLLHFVTRHTRRVEDAEDITQETFVRAYENIGRYQPQWRFSTWLFTIARRLSISRARRNQLAHSDDGLDAAADVSLEPAELLLAGESRSRLWDIAADTLDETKFTAIWLFYVEEMSVAEIAIVLDRSRVAVKTLLFRARKQLMPALADEVDSISCAVPAVAAEQKVVLVGDTGT